MLKKSIKRKLKNLIHKTFLERFLLNYDISKYSYEEAINKRRMCKSAININRMYYTINQGELVPNIIEHYKTYMFNEVIKIIDYNMGLLIFNGNYNAILKGALSTNDQEKVTHYLICSILTNINVLDTVTFSHIKASCNHSLAAKQAIFYCIKNKLLSDNDKLILSAYAGLDSSANINRNRVKTSTLIKYYAINSNWHAINNLQKKVRLNYNNRRILNTVFLSCINTGEHDTAKYLYDNYKDRINNSNICNYHFSKADFYSGYEEMKRRDMSVKCKRIFLDNYKQELESIPIDATLIVLNSWGVGDDIRYSTLIPQLISRYSKLQIACEPRLYILFTIVYPKVRFLKSNRTKVVNIDNFESYNELPLFELHHLMDNTLNEKIRNESDCFTLMTDIITQVPPSVTNLENFHESMKTIVTKRRIDDFVSNISKGNRILVGICWRSMISGTGRNDHYFKLKSILEYAKKNKDLVLVSLQYDLSPEDQSIAERYSENVEYYVPPIDLKNDFVSVLYLMTRLDFIVSAGTAVLELAGLSGTKTFLLSNSYMQRYRFNKCEKALTLTDRWFSNIEIVKDFEAFSKTEIIENTFNLIKKRA
ncbi:hypothetical protein AB4304_14515 [Vibrio breoganii]|uniref:hypothetical protein n=1 Tax=Vibrio breoganii TaxID=553239 RepID=UPI000C824C70|nr:hypothetical protein [Vibrio breoganii]PMK79551.1 hypothetical protein BCT94_18785 [Vibrio breoganii]